MSDMSPAELRTAIDRVERQMDRDSRWTDASPSDCYLAALRHHYGAEDAPGAFDAYRRSLRARHLRQRLREAEGEDSEDHQ